MFKIVSCRGRAKKKSSQPRFVGSEAYCWQHALHSFASSASIDVTLRSLAMSASLGRQRGYLRETHHLKVVLVAWNEFMCGSKTRDVWDDDQLESWIRKF